MTSIMENRWLSGFIAREDGAVTVDWIALTATIAFLGISATFYIGAAVPELADALVSYMDGMEVVPE